ncbi:MAG TPA: 4-hydroxythreonine-4-phosphate dehydrogenase PdxA, partial [Pirellulales bacterium]|nr:4-hydroxythreonine-4-phosphate dehydrogenase PdxA [Pirellulales bacterium]
MSQPRIAITMGDPAGVGPEIIVGSWSRPEVHAHCRPFVVGHPEIVRRACQLLGSRAQVVEIKTIGDSQPAADVIPCLRAVGDDALAIAPGAVDPRGGQASYDALVAAARLALAREVDALVTAPLSKIALERAGHHYPGHTELLA